MTENWERWDNLFKTMGAKHSVDWKILKAICMTESSLGTNKSVALGLANPKNTSGSASSDGKSWGLMQVRLKTARDLDLLVTPEKLNNAEYSIDLAAKYVSQLKKIFRTPDVRYLEWVIKSYNSGPGNVKKEMKGEIQGFANEYWRRFKNNYELVSAYL